MSGFDPERYRKKYGDALLPPYKLSDWNRQARPIVREITEHKVNPANDSLELYVADEPGHGNASHAYRIDLPNGTTYMVDFQNGPIAEFGVNGVTHEVLLAILADRLRSFQAGPYACQENGEALSNIVQAQHWLKSRTRARMARGVEGTHQL